LKKILLLVLLCPLSFAAEDMQRWSCQGTAAGGLLWTQNKWKASEFGTRIYRIEVENSSAAISENNDPILMLMDCESKTCTLRCSNDAAELEINEDTARAIPIRFFGGIYQTQESSQKDSIYIETLQCERF